MQITFLWKWKILFCKVCYVLWKWKSHFWYAASLIIGSIGRNRGLVMVMRDIISLRFFNPYLDFSFDHIWKFLFLSFACKHSSVQIFVTLGHHNLPFIGSYSRCDNILFSCSQPCSSIIFPIYVENLIHVLRSVLSFTVFFCFTRSTTG